MRGICIVKSDGFIKVTAIFASIVALIMMLMLSGCSEEVKVEDTPKTPAPSTGKIYLYGEYHGEERILAKELELWSEYYHQEGMRHLFIEQPYYTAEFLNLWLQSDNDDILDKIYNDWTGTLSHNPYVKEFYKNIKAQCPETIFHGTDIGHQYNSTGKRFLSYLEENNLNDSKQYMLAKEAIEQGEYYYSSSHDIYRENKMAENFIREFDKLDNESIMGIYGAGHTGLEAMDSKGSVPCMANQLKERYGSNVYSEDLSKLAKDIEPYRVDLINFNGKEYEASYFGKHDVSGLLEDFTYMEFWRLENSYDDFIHWPKADSLISYDAYPMEVEERQIFVVDYIKTDGSVIRVYYRSDGYLYEGIPVTEAFHIE